MKKLASIQRNQDQHWVGDGFPVRSIFSYDGLAEKMSPFLLLDYAGPTVFPASPSTSERRGVGAHPHRGFETVTIVYDGEVEHRDSAGAGGKIGPGDVQWMTAASGLVHQEYHGAEYAKRGGPFEMVQLWVNLPKKDKMSPPAYQDLTDAKIPRVELSDGRGSVRVIAGRFGDALGPAKTHSPINIWDLRLRSGSHSSLNVASGHTTAVFVLKGQVRVSGGEPIGDAELAILDRDGDRFTLDATNDTIALVLDGEPLNEPVVGYGPFVMNTKSEIQQAISDYQNGLMGTIAMK